MSMELVLILVVSAFLLVECASIFNNLFIVRGNYKTHDRERKNFKKQIDHLEKTIKKRNVEIRNLDAILRSSNKGYDDTAFILTSDGVKLMPKGWKAKLFT